MLPIWDAVEAHRVYDSAINTVIKRILADPSWTSTNPMHFSFHHEQYVKAEGGSIAAGTPLGTPTHWFDPCAFVPQPLGTFGNLGRNTLIGPGRSTIDFLVNKHFRISEKRELQFRTEVFNLLDHPNFEAPNSANRRIFQAFPPCRDPSTKASRP